jgi:hypothetical protein
LYRYVEAAQRGKGNAASTSGKSSGVMGEVDELEINERLRAAFGGAVHFEFS